MKAVLGQGVVGIVWALVSASALAAPAPSRVALRWNSPDECPDDAELVASVEGFLGQKLSEAREQELSASVNVVGSARDGFAAKLLFKSRGGIEERSLEHPECRKLMEGAALLIALAIDPERVKARQHADNDQAPAPAPTLAPSPPPPVVSKPVDPALSAVAPRREEASPEPVTLAASSSDIAPQLELFGFAGSGALPSAGPGLGAAFGLRGGRFELGLAGQYWLARSTLVQGGSNAEIELTLWTAAVRACAWPLRGAWSLRACIASGFGDLSGVGHDVENGEPRHALYSALSGDVSLRYGQGRLVPLLGVAGGWALSRPAFGVTLNGQKIEVFRPAWWSLQGLVGLAYRL